MNPAMHSFSISALMAVALDGCSSRCFFWTCDIKSGVYAMFDNRGIKARNLCV
jgi:hypothetical protein